MDELLSHLEKLNINYDLEVIDYQESSLVDKDTTKIKKKITLTIEGLESVECLTQKLSSG